jgi:hypothetical protein
MDSEDERRLLRLQKELAIRRKEASVLGEAERKGERDQRERAGKQGNSYSFVPRNRTNC